MMQFPGDFVWGVATSAYQIEGAAKADGRGESIWDRFSYTPGKVVNGENGDAACDHYHRYEEDLRLMASLGIRSYRFSFAWPRIFPDGTGQVNSKGMDFYRRLIEQLALYGIKPAATLYHWDLPQTLQDKGGWLNRDTAYQFADYAEALYREFGSEIPLWITHNEPWCAAFLGHATGDHAPGLKDKPASVKASHHLLLSHGLAVQAFRAVAPASARVGITLNLAPVYAASESEADQAAARRQDGFQNRWFLDPLYRGAYPADMVAYYSQWGPLDYIQPGDLEVIAAPTDFLGVNYYSRSVVKDTPASEYLQLDGVPPTAPLTDMGWEITPECLTDLLVRVKKDYGDFPIYITENGAAFPDKVNDSGEIDDSPRIAFLRGHFKSALKAIELGVRLKGYYVWSFMDNFEWAHGYTKRFGLVYVDYATQRRIPKKSALWYRDVIARNGL
ncbi:MAG: GH1 family beta-glucosidase [Firmicutes bacterium]|nr:GH1 family beta-glucosidase [Bacillota bacterium]